MAKKFEPPPLAPAKEANPLADPAAEPEKSPPPEAKPKPPAPVPDRDSREVVRTGVKETAIPPQIVDAIKKATVFLKVDSGLSAGRGSGFLINKDGTTAYIV